MYIVGSKHVHIVNIKKKEVNVELNLGIQNYAVINYGI